ncbi:MAG: hypothetical protein ABFS16_11880 [Bacteroidota bacterium]
MKKLQLFTIVALVCILVPTQSIFAQAEIEFNNTITFLDGKGGKFKSISSKTTTTPSGNIVKTATFQLPEGHHLIPEKGKEYIPVGITITDGYGVKYLLINRNIKVGKSGEFKVVLHLNGAGSEFPNGW